MTAEPLALLESDPDPAAGILAVADLREQRAKAATPGPWSYSDVNSVGGGTLYDKTVAIGSLDWDNEHVDPRIRRTRTVREADANGEHIAAEANPAHALAAVRRWREMVKRHHRAHIRPLFPQDEYSQLCAADHDDYPCADLTLTADEARAYLGGTP